jgi:hypothetical protein
MNLGAIEPPQRIEDTFSETALEQFADGRVISKSAGAKNSRSACSPS